MHTNRIVSNRVCHTKYVVYNKHLENDGIFEGSRVNSGQKHTWLSASSWTCIKDHGPKTIFEASSKLSQLFVPCNETETMENPLNIDTNLGISTLTIPVISTISNICLFTKSAKERIPPAIRWCEWNQLRVSSNTRVITVAMAMSWKYI